MLRPPAGRWIMTEEPPESVDLGFLMIFGYGMLAAVLGGIHGSDQIEGAKIAKENNSKLYGIDSKNSVIQRELSKTVFSKHSLGELLSVIKKFDVPKHISEYIKRHKETQKEIHRERETHTHEE